MGSGVSILLISQQLFITFLIELMGRDTVHCVVDLCLTSKLLFLGFSCHYMHFHNKAQSHIRLWKLSSWINRELKPPSGFNPKRLKLPFSFLLIASFSSPCTPALCLSNMNQISELSPPRRCRHELLPGSGMTSFITWAPLQLLQGLCEMKPQGFSPTSCSQMSLCDTMRQ